MMPPPPGCFALHMLDVGQGEAIIVDLPNEAFAIIDAGPHYAKDIVLDAIRARRNRSFRFAAYTHWDADHIGALPDVLRERAPQDVIRPNIEIGWMKALCAQLGDKDTPQLIDEVNSLEAKLQVFPMGARQEIRDVGAGAEVWALAPGMRARNNVQAALRGRSAASVALNLQKVRNDVSLVLWIRVFGRALLLPGEVDADMTGELRKHFARMPGNVPHDDPRAIWLKLSHHGSLLGSSEELFRVFGHDLFVASASHGARYGHPHPRTLAAVHQGGRGHAMCTRLGAGCRRILEAPAAHPLHDLAWTDGDKWKAGETEKGALVKRCYGTVSVVVWPDGACSVSGTSDERRDCPFGGPAQGRFDLGRP